MWDGTQSRADLVALDGSPLWRMVLERSVDDEQHVLALFWSRHRWMVSAYTGPTRHARFAEIREWLGKRGGPEADPYADRAGRWLMGGATVDGWTWFGFERPSSLIEFRDLWGRE